MSAVEAVLRPVMQQAVDACITHVDGGGLPFVGVVATHTGEVVSQFGVNQVADTGDPMAHAEVVAMRDAVARHGLDSLGGHVLLATGEPCGLCYRYAVDQGIDAIYVAVDRDEVAGHGFDYRASYPAFGITEAARAGLVRPLEVERGNDPFTHYLHMHVPRGATARPGTVSKGTSS